MATEFSLAFSLVVSGRNVWGYTSIHEIHEIEPHDHRYDALVELGEETFFSRFVNAGR